MLAPNDLRLLALLRSYEHWMRRPLSTVEELHDAPFAVLAHGTEASPILWYGNRCALELWEMDLEGFTRMPSRETAEPDLREAREALLRDVQEKGFSDGYSGVRISRSGRRFAIERATVWNILDDGGHRLGQAATFAQWRWLT